MAATIAQRRPYARTRSNKNLLWLPVAVFVAGLLAAAGWVTYVLWPRWPAAEMTLDAPSLPITINGVNFNIPPAAIRNKVQRKPGTQERIDLVFLWPSLQPPDLSVKAGPVASVQAVDRVFLTITAYGNTLPTIERFNTIYPRYLETSVATGDGGLALRPFRTGTPYQGEDMLYDPSDPERFLVRCTRDGKGATIGMCFYEKRVAQTDVTARFPRQWLAEWVSVRDGLDRLISGLRGASR